MSWISVCDENALPLDRGVAAWVGERAVAIFNLGEGGLFALDNIDPASGVSLLSRGLICDIQGHLCVASPLYKQHYRLVDGLCVEDPSLRAQIFELKNELGRIWVRAFNPI